MKQKEIVFKGYRFRSRLEARWAIFLDACGANWEYRTVSINLGNNHWFTPTFVLQGVEGRAGEELFVVVKGKDSTLEEGVKVHCFISGGLFPDKDCVRYGNHVYVVDSFPEGITVNDAIHYVSDHTYNRPFGYWPDVFSFAGIDGDEFAAHPGVNKDGKFELFGDDSSYLEDMDKEATEKAYRRAWKARFVCDGPGHLWRVSYA